MKGFVRLLAKSLPKQETEGVQARGAATYTGHIGCVMQAADILIEHLGRVILQQLAIDQYSLEEFSQTVKLGAYLHDWGKANQHFQEMVYWNSIDPKSKEPNDLKLKKQLREIAEEEHQGQMLRHEIISGILALRVPSFRKWLEQCPNANLFIAVWAAMGHHLKTGLSRDDIPVGCIAEISDKTGSKLKIYTHHKDFQAILRMGNKCLGLPEQLPDLPPEIWSKKELQNALSALLNEFSSLAEHINWEQQKFIAAVKATVIAADLAGSALPVAGEDLQQWIRQVLNLVLSEDELQALIDERLDGKPLRQFQEEIAKPVPNCRVKLVKAGCGTGKTIGAYAWAKPRAKGRKLFFCYPTTGTASQGYMDYADGTDIEATLMHSRADLDRELLFSGESDDSEGIDARLSAFQAWRKKLIICTVDSVLGLIQNNRRSLYAWPAIAQSAFVFDEVHAYGDRLFGALLQFLRTFRGAPILLMSASFTPSQLQKIREVMAEIGEPIEEPIEGPKELEALERYRIHSIDEVSNDLSEVWTHVLEALRKGQKVLWVTNSVQDQKAKRGCIDIYRLAKTKITQELCQVGIQPLIYHSRYRYRDRLEKHQAVIDAFKADKPVLAITTQVCEMSLDISADLLVSAMAPAAALIQRLGRLNRRMTRNEEGTRLAVIYPWDNPEPYKGLELPEGITTTTSSPTWDNPKPYKGLELETGKYLVRQLVNQPKVSQKDLAEIAAGLNSQMPEHVASIWLEGDWCTYSDFLRKGGYTITVLLQQDLATIRQQASERPNSSFMREAQGWSVPIRLPKNLCNWKRCRFYPIAPDDEIAYSEEVGAEPCN